MSEREPYLENLRHTVLKYKRLSPPDPDESGPSWFHVLLVAGYIQDTMIMEADARYAFGGSLMPFLGTDSDEPWYLVPRPHEAPSPALEEWRKETGRLGTDLSLLEFSDETLSKIRQLVRELPKKGSASVVSLKEISSNLYDVCREVLRKGGMKVYERFRAVSRLSEAIMEAQMHTDAIPDLVAKTVKILRPYVETHGQKPSALLEGQQKGMVWMTDELPVGELKRLYLRNVEESIHVEVVSNRTELAAGRKVIVFCLPIDFDSPELFFRRVEGKKDEWEVSDDGMTISELETLGLELTNARVREIVALECNLYGFRYDEEFRAFSRIAKREDLGRAVNAFHQLVLTLRAGPLWLRESSGKEVDT